MELTQRPAGRQEQTHRLLLSPAMKQSLDILQAGLWDLRQLVLSQLDANPLLEAGEAPGDALPFSPVPLHRLVTPGLAWNPDCPAEPLPRGENFYDMLEEQIRTMELPAPMVPVCLALVGCLDRRGYLDIPPEELAQALQLPAQEVYQALYVLQSLTPCGVGARTLEECLILQLAQGPHFNGDTIAIVHKGLELLAANQMGKLAALLHRPPDKIKEACQAIRALNPIPSRGYDTGEEPQVLIPDALVECQESLTTIRMNDEFVPRLVIHQDYAALAQSADEATARFVQGMEEQARGLIRSLEGRKKTLLRVLEEVVKRQPTYFSKGTGLAPMTMGQVAQSLELDLSTISRTVQDKVLVCAAGTVSLRSLFTGGYAAAEGVSLSAVVIKKKIQEFIGREDSTAPLTDLDLCHALAAGGTVLARRTVVKYRAELGIPPSTQRRR